jgi:glucans biosynthesis protein
VPDFLLKLDYDEHRDIRFKPARSIWREEGLPFQLQFFHLGSFFNRPVAIHLVEGGVARPFLRPQSLRLQAEPLPGASPPDLG